MATHMDRRADGRLAGDPTTPDPVVRPLHPRPAGVGVALRILAEPRLIDAAFRANPADWAAFEPVIIDILMNRR